MSDVGRFSWCQAHVKIVHKEIYLSYKNQASLLAYMVDRQEILPNIGKGLMLTIKCQ